LSAAAAESLSKHEEDLHLDRLNLGNLSDAAAKNLRKHHSFNYNWEDYVR